MLYNVHIKNNVPSKY